MTLYQDALSFLILASLGIYIYTKIKHQTLRDTIHDIKDLISDIKS